VVINPVGVVFPYVVSDRERTSAPSYFTHVVVVIFPNMTLLRVLFFSDVSGGVVIGASGVVLTG